jgi:hypothetical protein
MAATAILRMTLFSSAVFLGFSGPAQSVTIMGSQASCGKWVQQRSLPQHPARAQDEAWIAGYLSGINIAASSGDLLRGLDDEAIYSWMDNYCRSHPLEGIADAAEKLIFDLKKRVPASRSR